MAGTVKKVEYYYTVVSDRAGSGSKVLSALKKSGVDLVAYTGFPIDKGHAQLDFVPTNQRAFQAASSKAGFKLVGPKTAFLIQGEDKKGAVADILAKLANAKISVTAMNAVAAGRDRYGAILWVKPRNVNQAAKVLGAK